MEPFSQQIETIIRDPLIIGDHELDNTWWVLISPDDKLLLSVEIIKAYIDMIIESREKALLTQRGYSYPMQFYCWFDHMACQIRFSLTSIQNKLPFGCDVNIIDALDSIIGQALSNPPFIPWEELKFIDSMDDYEDYDDYEDKKAYILDVYVQIIPTGS